MPDVSCPRHMWNGIAVLALLLATSAEAPGQDAAKTQQPVIAGFERFYTKAGADAVKGGQLLLGELSCTSCHTVDPARETVVRRKAAPILDGVGGRVRPGYLRKFLSDPHGTKPGTAMPDVLAGIPAAERAAQAEALVHFLASTGAPRVEKPQKKLIAAGRDLYHKVGCVACHGTRDASGRQDRLFANAVPLGDVAGKYTLQGLRTFLENPHLTRPSGRMPRLLDSKEAVAVANYLSQGAHLELASAPNMKYAYYEGDWQDLPDFAKLKPVATGAATGFDLSLARRENNMALRFEGFLKVERDGDYQFSLTSDDGSKLWIDGKVVVDNDGVHAPTEKAGTARLARGVHPIVAAVFNAGGGVELSVEIAGPGLPRQSVSALVFLTPQGNPRAKKPAAGKGDGPFTVQAPLADKGRALFASAGCASCHELTAGKRVASTLQAPALAKLPPKGGCLSPTPRAGVPHYPLNDRQRTALAAAIQAPVPADKLTPADTIGRVMTTFNCYACHERNQVGGVLADANPSFGTAQPEMGDEGRLPPSLTGVGAKLNGEFLRQILDTGAHDRPYMYTRMPGFGNPNVGVLVAMLENADPAEPDPKIAFNVPLQKVKAEARAMTGAGALACIKCHTFAKNKAEGVQGLDMTLMTQRLRKGWFHKYMVNPSRYRPGTRMPTSFPDGETQLPKYLGGSAAKQIEGLWLFLADGAKAALPPGVKKLANPLVPTDRAIVYRNFIAGAGPRGIAVGYPEQAHLAFDANNLRLALIWQGAFIDASRHWNGRGEGFEPPAGDNVVSLPSGVSFAVLANNAAWPKQSARELPGYQFNGYRVSKDDRPTFLYTVHGVKIEDFPNAVAGTPNPSLRRTLNLTAADPVAGLFFRAATASKITALGDGWYQVNDLKMRIESADAPQIRQVGGQSELLVPVSFKDGRARIVQEFQW